MQYWRMQVHPNEGEVAVQHSINSLAAGFIGLDFRDNLGDLLVADRDSLPTNQKDYWAFAHDMQIGDKVLVICHHFPFAVVTIDGEYNYIRTPVYEIGVWFRHFPACQGCEILRRSHNECPRLGTSCYDRHDLAIA